MPKHTPVHKQIPKTIIKVKTPKNELAVPVPIKKVTKSGRMNKVATF